MNDSKNVSVVPLAEIDVSSEHADKFLFTYNRNINNLEKSISKVGLINPVTLVKGYGESGKLSIVCGLQRLNAHFELGINNVDAFVLDYRSEEELLLLSLHDNLFSREFNEIEKAIVLKKFTDIGYSQERLISDIVGYIDIAPNKKVLEKYETILNLEKELKDDVSNNDMEMEKAIILSQLDKTERGFVYDLLFKESQINLNETKDAVKNLIDLKQVKQMEITEILTSDGIADLIRDKKLNKKQKGEKICKLIKYKRYPTICDHEDKFEKVCKELGLDNNVRINHSRYFEKNDIQITIKASDEKKLEESINKLVANIENGKLREVLAVSRCSTKFDEIKK